MSAEDKIEQIIGWLEVENKMYQDSLDRGAMGIVSATVTRTLIDGNNKTIKYLKLVREYLPISEQTTITKRQMQEREDQSESRGEYD